MEKATSKKGTASRTEATEEPKNRPIQSYRQDDVSVSIWKREVKNRVYYNCSFERSYRDANGRWRYTRSFSLDDLGSLISLAQRASEYMDRLVNPDESEPVPE